MNRITYTYNIAGLIAYGVAALLIFGITPVPALTQNETILTGLLALILLGEGLTLEIKGRSRALALAVWVSFPIFFGEIIYAFATLVTG